MNKGKREHASLLDVDNILNAFTNAFFFTYNA